MDSCLQIAADDRQRGAVWEGEGRGGGQLNRYSYANGAIDNGALLKRIIRSN